MTLHALKALALGTAEQDTAPFLTEWTASQALGKFRRAEAGIIGDSFPTISSSGSNAAIIHHHCTEAGAAPIDVNAGYLCDTGGQYDEGTTDVTRTVHFGRPSEEEARCFTRVLQGHIGLAMAIFPQGTTGAPSQQPKPSRCLSQPSARPMAF